jgi:hypothetical protein
MFGRAQASHSLPGGLKGANVLVASATVTNDTAIDTLTGGAGQDWFFRDRVGTGVSDGSDLVASELAIDL